MAYIIPNTDVRILKGIKLDPSYANTIYFANETAQYTYFVGKTKYLLSNLSYQRVELGVIRVQLTEASLHDCCYIMFKNTSYENKWFYGFITEVDYINDTTSDIHYQLDLVQTWLFEMELMPCLIERTHIPSNQDTIGANILPENVSLGEYVHSNQNVIVNLHSKAVIIQVADEEQDPIIPNIGAFHDGAYSGAKLWVKRIHEGPSPEFAQDLITIKNFLNNYIQKPDAIIGMYMIPQFCINYGVNSNVDATWLYDNYQPVLHIMTGSLISGNEFFGGYKPHNKKLYTYPYNFHEFLTNDGQTMKMRYEFCTELQPKLVITGTMNTPVQICARPIDYKGINRQQNVADWVYEDYEEHINLTNFPLCSWVNDYYNAWVAQNGLPMALGLAMTGAGMYKMSQDMIGEAVLSPAGEITQKKIAHFMQLDPQNPKHQKWFDQIPEPKYSDQEILSAGLPNMVSALTSIYEASIHADQFRGTLNTSCVDYANNSVNIYQRRTHITEEYAKLIDTFFDMYGYAIGEIRSVDRNVRPYWTYVKTKNCCIKGDCNARDISFVESLYNRGITWWTNGDLIGRYDLAADNHN